MNPYRIIGTTPKNSGKVTKGGSTATLTKEGTNKDGAAVAKEGEEGSNSMTNVPMAEAQVIGTNFGSPVILGKRQLEKGEDLEKVSKVFIIPKNDQTSNIKGFVRYISYPLKPYTAENLYTARGCRWQVSHSRHKRISSAMRKGSAWAPALESAESSGSHYTCCEIQPREWLS